MFVPFSVIVNRDKLYIIEYDRYYPRGSKIPSLHLLMQGENIQQVACGWSFAIIVKENNDVIEITCALNNDDIYHYETRILMQGEQIRQVACGEKHAVILKANNELFVYRGNSFGQLGLGHQNYQHELQLLMRGERIRQIACGEQHTVILKANNDVLVFGKNLDGELGLGDYINRSLPQILMQQEEIKQISCGMGYTIILKNNNNILVFGRNDSCQLGLNYYEYGNLIRNPTMLIQNNSIREIITSAMGCHTIIRMDDNVIGFGDNDSYQLGLVKYDNKFSTELLECQYNNNNKCQQMFLMKDKKIRQIAVLYNCTMVLKTNGDVLVFGDPSNSSHAEMDVQNKPQLLPIKATMLPNQTQNATWYPENHQYFSDNYQICIKTFLLVHQDLRNRIGINIPKFVRFEIIKHYI